MLRYHQVALSFVVLSIPFNGIRPILSVGELSSEGLFYSLLIYIMCLVPCALQKFKFTDVANLFESQKIYILLIAVSIIFHLNLIEFNSYGDRTGLERYVLSVATYAFYFVAFCVMLMQARIVGVERFVNWLAGAFVVLGVGLSIISTIELASWFSDALHDLFLAFRSIFVIEPKAEPFRLAGVSMEPSFNAFALLACVPWVAYRAVGGRLRYRLLAGFLIILCLLSGARTAYVGLAAMGVAFVLAKGLLRRPLPGGLDGALLVLAAFVLGVVTPVFLYANIDAESSISTVTRSYMGMAAISAGLENIWGQGYGQVAFSVVRQVSSLIQYSWELADFYQGSRYGQLPPLFSWYARTIGEFGIVGYAILSLSFALTAKRIFQYGHRATNTFERQLFVIAALLIAQFLAIGLSIESIRVPQYWFAWFAGSLIWIHKSARERSAKWTDFDVQASTGMPPPPRCSRGLAAVPRLGAH
jgi:hypothetical protein